MQDTAHCEGSLDQQSAEAGSSASRATQAIEVYANLRDGRSIHTPVFDVSIDFDVHGNTQPDLVGYLLVHTWMSTYSESRQPTTRIQKDNLALKLRRIIDYTPIAEHEWRAAIGANRANGHGCEDRYCTLTQVVSERLRRFLSDSELCDRLWSPTFSRRVTRVPSYFKIRLAAPVCPLAPPAGTPQEIIREHLSPETRFAFTNVSTLCDPYSTAVCVLVKPRYKTETYGSVRDGEELPREIGCSVIATDEHGKETGSEQESAARVFIASALARRSITEAEWVEAEMNAPIAPSIAEMLTQYVTTLLRRHCSERQEAEDVDERPPEMTVMVALAKSEFDLAIA